MPMPMGIGGMLPQGGPPQGGPPDAGPPQGGGPMPPQAPTGGQGPSSLMEQLAAIRQQLKDLAQAYPALAPACDAALQTLVRGMAQAAPQEGNEGPQPQYA